MTWELEGLISHLLMIISCAGEDGYLVVDFVDSIKEVLLSFANKDPPSGWTNMSHDIGPTIGNQGISTIWKWLANRNDVSVGCDRNYNHLTFDAVLSLAVTISDYTKCGSQLSEQPELPFHTPGRCSETEGLRLYASEDTMWEAITGHSVNHKRVPRSEWLLLLGIASTKSQGILQGDLGRLVDQDKRSVPKRTDALVRKGYIIKRTTLVRGTKTSKMWLKPFAPSLPRDGGHELKPEMEMNLSSHLLSISLDPVPWHGRWTGESVDYTALSTTIMAICKEWGVIRMQDLKAKLGILGMRWQMKVVSKICRFLNARDAIKYVAARLENKIFKDCIRFNHDLSAKDWSIFLATGKRTDKPIRVHDLHIRDKTDKPDQIGGGKASFTSHLSFCPPWSSDQPLPTTIAKAIIAFGEKGLANPDVYGLTLGCTFTRFLSSMTTSMSTPNIQPIHLRHLQVRSEHARVGKVASYRYTIPLVTHRIIFTTEETLGITDPSPEFIQARSPYVLKKVSFDFEDDQLADICGVILSHRKQRGRIRRIKSGSNFKNQGVDEGEDYKGNIQLGLGSERLFDEKCPQNSRSLFVTLHVGRDTLQAVMSSLKGSLPKNLGSATQSSIDGRAVDSDASVPPSKNMISTNTLAISGQDGVPQIVRGRGRGRVSGGARRGTNRQRDTPSRAITNLKPWICNKCGGSWKNDIGLKYHLEKSQTSCNSSFSPSAREAALRDKEVPLFSRLATTSREETGSPPSSSSLVLHDRPPGAQPRLQDNASIQCSSHLTDQRPSKSDKPGDQKPRLTFHDNGDGASHPGSSQLLAPQSSSTYVDRILVSSFGLGNGAIILKNAAYKRRILSVKNNLQHISIMRESAAVQSDGGNGQSSNIMEHSATISSSNPEVSYLSQTQHGKRTFLQSGVILSILPAGSEITVPGLKDTQKKRPPEKKTARNEIAEKIVILITDMLLQNRGVLAGGEPLWQTVHSTWTSKFPQEPLPKSKDLQWALSRMLKSKAIIEHWHGYQSNNGLFSKCQVISLPHLDAFSDEILHLIEKMKQIQPQIIMPIELTTDTKDAQLNGQKVIRRGRRVLAGEVAILDAPVYAAQVAAKRGPELRMEGPHLFKRRKLLQQVKNSSNDTTASHHLGQEAYLTKLTACLAPDRAGYGFNCGHHHTGPGHFNRELIFLKPNTQLGEEHTNERKPSLILETSDGLHDLLKEDAFGLDTLLKTNQTDQIFLAEPSSPIRGCDGIWPVLESHYFERNNSHSFTMSGWMPSTKWFNWESMFLDIEERAISSRGMDQNSLGDTYSRFEESLRACLDVELTWADSFINKPPLFVSPHNIFITFSPYLPISKTPSIFTWVPGEQKTLKSFGVLAQELKSTSPSSDEVDSQVELEGEDIRRPTPSFRPIEPQNAKRVALATRSLMSILPQTNQTANEHSGAGKESQLVDSRDRTIAAFIAVRVLLGGADKAIDWGLLTRIFPLMTLDSLRRFWAAMCKEEGSYIKKFTKDFQIHLIKAFEKNELPLIDFENPQGYDWQGLIEWAVRIPHQGCFHIPQTRGLLDGSFSVTEAPYVEQDWREKFFHVQSSIFSRFEAVTSEPGAVVVDGMHCEVRPSRSAIEINVARSWVKSLCSTEETKYSGDQIRAKFLTLSSAGPEQSAGILKEAVDQLTRRRVICRSKKPPLGGRPYRLSEWYTSTLEKLSQRTKFEDAAAFKARMDTAFRQQKPLKIPYTLSDGAVMALINMSANGRIELIPLGIPDIPFGFEPGNYESRKFPKSYYHFTLQAVPTPMYKYNEDIHVLGAVVTQELPSVTSGGEIPQWVDFFGQNDKERWSEILRAFCFAFATRGPLTIEGVCNVLQPIIEGFEAVLIMEWGRKTGLFEDSTSPFGNKIREWWWLAVPWQLKNHNMVFAE